MRGDDSECGPLCEWRERQVRDAVDAYLADPSPDAPPPLGDSLAAARAAFGAMKAKLLEAAGGHSKGQDVQLDAVMAQVSNEGH